MATQIEMRVGRDVFPTSATFYGTTVTVGLTATQLPLGSLSGQNPTISGVLKID